MTVLVTRPDRQGRQLCQLLADVGIESIHHPLITIEPEPKLEQLSGKLGTFDIVIAVSQHAVTYAHQAISSLQKNWPTTPLYLAVGQKTAQILSKASQQSVNYPHISDSEHLLAMEELGSVADKRILILRGNGGRELIFDTLVSRKAHVEYQQVYRRINLPFMSEPTVSHWQSNDVDTLIITSSGQLEHLYNQIDALYHSWLHALLLVVPSERIAADAKKMGFNHIISASSASNQNLMEALQLKEQDIRNDK
ncbi:uroporphyrinogen-III synthase [Vibrio sp. SCSIO 43135]|uniref:uroporphyrinogen-III synthase n=1 Tax=Vibrio sp. SCSIO 43135 TaxID=2819096 RepID=UPI0020763A00|nr:uroporphyrinogen-III synthase [Vibrio sp. SCSIO 43135]USD41034.1 uroporphyrinogen-III synthase [Vibrio sp. SCSIO 43135]